MRVRFLQSYEFCSNRPCLGLFALFAAIAKPADVWFFPFVGLGMLFAGVAFVRLARWFSRNDRKYLYEAIKKALG